MKLYLSAGSDIAETAASPGKAHVMLTFYRFVLKDGQGKINPTIRTRRLMKIRKKARGKLRG